jgi:hypothetical protein
MKQLIAAIIGIALCSAVPACDTSTEPRDLGPVPSGSLTTDATGYVADRVGSTGLGDYEFSVISRFENTTAAPVYLVRCSPDSPRPEYLVSTADGSEDESAYNPIWACVGGAIPFEILPGAVRIDTFHVQGPNSFDEVKKQSSGRTEGVFRLSILVGSGGSGTPAVPDSLGVSNAFVVRTSE